MKYDFTDTDGWISGAALKATQVEETCDLPASHRKDDPQLSNDSGNRWLSGQKQQEWLRMSGTFPDNTC